MDKKMGDLIEYLNDLLMNPKPRQMPKEYLEIRGMEDLDLQIRSIRKSIMDISRGNLSEKIYGRGYSIGAVKNLQATLKSLAWNVKAISAGDFSQEVDFLGDFSDAFNIMVKNISQIIADLEASEERHRLLADNASDVVWTMDINGRMTYISPSVEKLRGYTVEEVMKQSGEDLVAAGSIDGLKNAVEEAIDRVENKLPFGVYRGDIELPCKDGSKIWVDLTISGIYDKNNKFLGMLGVYKDITERKIMEDTVRFLSETDRLTQLNNRFKLDEVLRFEIKRVLRGGMDYSVILIDIDNFKDVNDNYGHLIGDDVLVDMAKLIKSNIRDTDIVGRWGGEEFMIVAPLTDAEGGGRLAEKIRKEIESYKFPKAGYITASFGVADSRDLSDETKIVSRADIALYQSKNTGKNKVSIYDESIERK